MANTPLKLEIPKLKDFKTYSDFKEVFSEFLAFAYPDIDARHNAVPQLLTFAAAGDQSMLAVLNTAKTTRRAGINQGTFVEELWKALDRKYLSSEEARIRLVEQKLLKLKDYAKGGLSQILFTFRVLQAEHVRIRGGLSQQQIARGLLESLPESTQELLQMTCDTKNLEELLGKIEELANLKRTSTSDSFKGLKIEEGYALQEKTKRKMQQKLNKTWPRLGDRRKQNVTFPLGTCQYCGLKVTHSKKEDCPAYGKKCNICKKKNHFARVCKSNVKDHAKVTEEADSLDKGKQEVKDFDFLGKV